MPQYILRIENEVSASNPYQAIEHYGKKHFMGLEKYHAKVSIINEKGHQLTYVGNCPVCGRCLFAENVDVMIVDGCGYCVGHGPGDKERIE